MEDHSLQQKNVTRSTVPTGQPHVSTHPIPEQNDDALRPRCTLDENSCRTGFISISSNIWWKLIPGGIRERFIYKWYNLMSDLFKDNMAFCMNYGYGTIDEESNESLADIPAPNQYDQYCLKMYRHVVGDTTLKGKHILEVSCGRGGGSSFIMDTYRPLSMVGIDFSTTCITFCQERYTKPGLTFYEGNAETLNFPDEVFDAVINIEASHNYNNMDKFIAESFRVLKPRGRLLFADFRKKKSIPQLRREFVKSGFTITRETAITPNVMKSLEDNSEIKKSLINEHIPFVMRLGVSIFSSLDKTPMYRAFKKGELEYMSFILQKEG
jgi:ubiquinone/menaquinone biosynthesis C-methylase UbiE